MSRASTAYSLSSCDVTDDSDEELSPIRLNCRIPAFSYPLPSSVSEESVIEHLVDDSVDNPVINNDHHQEKIKHSSNEGSVTNSEVAQTRKQSVSRASAHKLANMGESNYYSFDDCDDEGICLVSKTKKMSLSKIQSTDLGSDYEDASKSSPTEGSDKHWEDEATVPQDHWSRQLVTPEHVVVKQHRKLQRMNNNCYRPLLTSNDSMQPTITHSQNNGGSCSLQTIPFEDRGSNEILDSAGMPTVVSEEVIHCQRVSDLSQGAQNGARDAYKKRQSSKRLVKQSASIHESPVLDHPAFDFSPTAISCLDNTSNDFVAAPPHTRLYVCQGCGNQQPLPPISSRTRSTQTEQTG